MTMREKLARAHIGNTRFDDPTTHDQNGIQIISPREVALVDVDLLLSMLMHPNTAMLKAGEMTLASIEGSSAITESLDTVAREVFRAMINAAHREWK